MSLIFVERVFYVDQLFLAHLETDISESSKVVAFLQGSFPLTPLTFFKTFAHLTSWKIDKNFEAGRAISPYLLYST